MLKQVALGDLLRYALSGAVFVGTYAISRHGSAGPGQLLGTTDRSVIVAVGAILAGVLTYALHRAIYRVITRVIIGYLRLRGLIRTPFSGWCGFHESEFRRDYARWVRHHNYPLFHERLQLWASHVHFLYCSAWAAFAGAFLGRLLAMSAAQPPVTTWFAASPDKPCFMAALWLGGICFWAAFVQDCSLTYYDCRFCADCGFDPSTPNLRKHLRPPIQEEEASNE